MASPAVAFGMAVVGCDDGNVYAFDIASGHQIWNFTTGSKVRSTAAIDVDGNIVFGSYDSYIYKLSSRGQLIWKYKTGFSIYGPATIGPDNTIYIGSFDSYLYAIDSNTGTLKWRFRGNTVINGGPALGSGMFKDYVVAMSYGAQAYAVNTTTGALIWQFDYQQQGGGSSAVIVDATVYIGSWDGYFYAIDLVTGKKRWAYETNGEVESHGAYHSGVVYGSSESAEAFALDAATGREIWKYTDFGEEVNGSPTVTDDYVFVGANDKYMYALHKSDGIRAWRFLTEANVFSSAAVADTGMIYFTCNTGTLLSSRLETERLMARQASGHGVDPLEVNSVNIGVFYAVNPQLQTA